MSGRTTYCCMHLLHDNSLLSPSFISHFLAFLQACCIPISSTRNNKNSKNREENKATLKFSLMFKFYDAHVAHVAVYIYTYYHSCCQLALLRNSRDIYYVMVFCRFHIFTVFMWLRRLYISASYKVDHVLSRISTSGLRASSQS